MICPFELIVMPSTAPRFMSGEYLRKLGFESNGISGAVTVPGAGGAAGACWALTVRPPDKCTKSAAPTTPAIDRDRNRFTMTSQVGLKPDTTYAPYKLNAINSAG